MEYWNAKEYYLPTAWDYINDDTFEAERYFMTEGGSDKVNFEIFKDVCNASVILCEYIIKLRSKQRLRIHPGDKSDNQNDRQIEKPFEKQLLFYKNKTIRFSGTNNWKMFKLLYEANGDPVADRVLVPNTDQQPNIVVGELRRYLKKQNAPEIASAISKINSPGYYLIFDEL